MTEIVTTLVPREWVSGPEHRARIADSLNNAIKGKLNCTGSVTLTISSATTTLTDIRIGLYSVILLMPTTANASAEIGNGTIYFGTPGNGTVTINHANNAQADRTFTYAIIG